MASSEAITRRRFLRNTGAAAIAASMMTARNRAQAAGANEALNVGIIGCGGMAWGHLEALLGMRQAENVHIRAVCDVYQKRARTFQDKVRSAGDDEPRLTCDYREVLAMKDVDYVLIATPEHSHHYLTMAALEAGKHVYVEKPIAHTIPEALEIVDRARATGLKVQVGIQGMSDDSYASAGEAIRAGRIGPVVQAQIDYVRWYPPQRGPWRDEGLDPAMPRPDDLDWEAWLRPAQKRPWEASRYFNWRCYRDYSGGIATDLFVHRVARMVRALGLEFPSRVVGMGGIYLWPDGRELPDNFELIAEYPPIEGVSKGLTLHVLGTMANDRGIDHCIRGHRGTLTFTGNGWKIVEQGKPQDQPAEVHTRTGGEDVGLHHRNLIAVLRGRVKELNCPPELGLYAFAPTAMANESWFTGKAIGWDKDRRAMVPI